MKSLISTLFSAILLVSAGTTLAEGYGEGPGRAGPRHARGMHGMPMVEHLVRALHRLDLSEEQKGNIHDVLRAMKADIHPVMSETKAGHEQLKELIKAASYDEKAVAALAAQEGQLAAERVVIASRALSSVFGFLTDAQREELNAMSEHHKQHRSELRRHKKHSSSN